MQCRSGKVTYQDKQTAWNAKTKMNDNHKKADVYKCELCDKWHLGRGQKTK